MGKLYLFLVAPRSVRLYVPWRSSPRSAAALGHRHAGCLQLSHRRPPEMCGLRIRPRTDVDPPRVELPSAGAYRLASTGAITCYYIAFNAMCMPNSKRGSHVDLRVAVSAIKRFQFLYESACSDVQVASDVMRRVLYVWS